MEGTFTPLFKDKKNKKKSKSRRNQGFSYYFCLAIEGSGSRRIRIRNTALQAQNSAVEDRGHSQNKARRLRMEPIDHAVVAESHYYEQGPDPHFF
jgi:hypothetical protein